MHFFKKHKKTLIIIGSVTTGLVTVGCISLYAIRQKPIRAAFSSYDINNNDIDRKEIFKKKDGVGNLIVVSHSFAPIDQLIMASEFVKYTDKKFNETCFISYESNNNKRLNRLLGGTNNNMIYTTRNNTDTVDKCIEKLNNGQNIVIFLHLGRDSTGIYHIINNSKCNIVLAKITHNSLPITYLDTEKNFIKIYSTILTRTFRHYHLEYDTFEEPTPDETPQEYMKRLKQQIYLET
jgi:hypothetical protein